MTGAIIPSLIRNVEVRVFLRQLGELPGAASRNGKPNGRRPSAGRMLSHQGGRLRGRVGEPSAGEPALRPGRKA